ncbi:hypothetical protein LTR37_017718 [Vermiconidia calcicola]|uniref:Uncharacterized protein n=1 Tax=Vermiconidia calcicola TaxID=1690605 RepID=A0ACC3MJD9_9PEZI|nr:hypothetical protein LTR37_017718 [Vermiconidia calcicola]
MRDRGHLVQNLFLVIQTFAILSNFVVKGSFALLLARVASTNKFIERSSKALCGLTSALGVLAALVVIVPCWPQARVAYSLHDSYRWIVLTILDVVSEFLIIGLPLFTLRKLQFRSSGQKWKLALVIVLGRISVIPLSISFCVALLRAHKHPFLGRQILDPLYRQQGELFASLITSTLVPVLDLFHITKLEVSETSVELNITKTVEVQWHEDQGKGALTSSAASLSPSTQADTKELL